MVHGEIGQQDWNAGSLIASFDMNVNREHEVINCKVGRVNIATDGLISKCIGARRLTWHAKSCRRKEQPLTRVLQFRCSTDLSCPRPSLCSYAAADRKPRSGMRPLRRTFRFSQPPSQQA
jgi:hypothetical protein